MSCHLAPPPPRPKPVTTSRQQGTFYRSSTDSGDKRQLFIAHRPRTAFVLISSERRRPTPGRHPGGDVIATPRIGCAVFGKARLAA